MSIRSAAIGDGAALACLLGSLGYPGAEILVDASWLALLIHPDAALREATDEDAVVGFISLHFIPQRALPDAFCRISYFGVDEAARGNGVGAKLEQTAQGIRASPRFLLRKSGRLTPSPATPSRVLGLRLSCVFGRRQQRILIHSILQTFLKIQ